VRISWNLPKTKKQQGNIDVFAHCGFVVNSRFPWLGASPDFLVFDGAEANSFGIGEVKCPFSKKGVPNSTVYGHTECQLVWFCCFYKR
jgi:hypothetical protein